MYWKYSLISVNHFSWKLSVIKVLVKKNGILKNGPVSVLKHYCLGSRQLYSCPIVDLYLLNPMLLNTITIFDNFCSQSLLRQLGRTRQNVIMHFFFVPAAYHQSSIIGPRSVPSPSCCIRDPSQVGPQRDMLKGNQWYNPYNPGITSLGTGKFSRRVDIDYGREDLRNKSTRVHLSFIWAPKMFSFIFLFSSGPNPGTTYL